MWCRKTRGYIARGTRGGGLIYAIQSVDGGPIKFGVSGSPEARLAELQTGNPAQLILIAYAAVHAQYEKLIHYHLREERLQGEWFKPTDKALAVVDSLRRQVCHPEEHSVINHIYAADLESIVWFRRQLGGYDVFGEEIERAQSLGIEFRRVAPDTAVVVPITDARPKELRA